MYKRDMYSYTNMNKISINHSTRKKSSMMCHVKRRSINADFVLIFWIVIDMLAIDGSHGRLILRYIRRKKNKAFVFRKAAYSDTVAIAIYFTFLLVFWYLALFSLRSYLFSLWREATRGKNRGKESSETYFRSPIQSASVRRAGPKTTLTYTYFTHNFSPES